VKLSRTSTQADVGTDIQNFAVNSLTFSPGRVGGNCFSEVGKCFELNFFIRKLFL